MRTNLRIAFVYTLVTTILLGLAYPAAVTALAQALFHHQANGELISSNGNVIGSSLLGQSFTGDAYFHPRPSYAGTGYDAANSSGSNLGPTSKKLVDRVTADVATAQTENLHPGAAVPADLATTSASGLDPHISPASAEFQVARVAKARNLSEDKLRALVARHTQGRQFGFLGEPRVNVLELNLDLNAVAPLK